MAIDPSKAKVARPCPASGEHRPRPGGAQSIHCQHCEKSVHVLSNMTEAQARERLQAHRGQEICISYQADEQGQVRFASQTARPRIVPPQALTRRSQGRAAAVAAVGFSAALAACTPHENPRFEPDALPSSTERAENSAPKEASAPKPQNPESREVIVGGRVVDETELRAHSGKLSRAVVERIDATAPDDEPCQSKSKPPQKPRRKKIDLGQNFMGLMAPVDE